MPVRGRQLTQIRRTQVVDDKQCIDGRNRKVAVYIKPIRGILPRRLILSENCQRTYPARELLDCAAGVHHGTDYIIGAIGQSWEPLAFERPCTVSVIRHRQCVLH